MAYSDIELQRIKRDVGGLCEKKSPAHLRDQLRVEYKIENQSVILCEVRPQWGHSTVKSPPATGPTSAAPSPTKFSAPSADAPKNP